MANRLVDSTSPYLLQHKDNPVDWYPWGEEALERARAEDKPIFLSVGYSACHWCHVMERESFENEQLAAILNRHFVAIKVDREERPDIDQIYMQAVQMLTGSGGWPMSVFLSPDGKPFFGGTYWPPDSRWGRPGFGQVLLAVADAWQNKREEISRQGEQLTEHLQHACRGPSAAESELDRRWIEAADAWLLRNHDSIYGGFGGAPKFPHAVDLWLQIELEAVQPKEARRASILLTLDKMSRGGIYDHLGGGFARYSVDEKWLVPHFEKMLYDNALLTCVYADAFRLWGFDEHGRVVQETLDYVLRDMTHVEGCFYSTEDADSEGVEGKFYVWSMKEVLEVLGEERGGRFCDVYDVTATGNFEEANILNLPKAIHQYAQLHGLDPRMLELELVEGRKALLERRSQRIRPGLDNKVLLGWNALMINALVRGYRALGDTKYLHAARAAVDFIVNRMRREDGSMWHTWLEGKPALEAYLDDVSYLVDALVELFQIDPQVRYLTHACELADRLLAEFADPEGGFFFTGQRHEQLIARSKDLADSSIPSGNGTAALALLNLGRLTGREAYVEAARGALVVASGVMSSSPQAAAQSLRGLLRYTSPAQEWVFIAPSVEGGEDARGLGDRLLAEFKPTALTIAVTSDRATAELQSLCPVLAHREVINDQPTLYLCESMVCQAPLVGGAIEDFLDSASQP
jgi:uncharacterized protein